MKNLLSRILLTLPFLMVALLAHAQDMEVTDGVTAPYTPENLITNVFLGEGIEVTSFQYDGAPEAVGYFNHGFEEVGIERGIIMTTGNAAEVAGVGNTFASTDHTPDLTADADLMQLDPNNQNHNVSRYIISFIPTSDTVRFNYAFASEEYPEYSCSSFNDVFGFFISGPGINGPFTNDAENIALIPNTTTYVSINNLHPDDSCPAVNEEYYNSNNGTNNQPVYDGFTDVFTAEAIVIPCEVYTIKLVISDKGDGIFDSGVFLEAKSFGSPPLDIDISTVSLDGGIVEGCAEALLTISLPDPVESDFFLDYEILGDAINGVDYSEVPLDLFIPAGESSVSVVLEAFEDNVVEGQEQFAIAVQVDPCNLDTFYIPINENQLIEPDLGPDITQCASETVILDASIDIPLPPVPTFTNETDYSLLPVGAAIMSPINVAGVQPFTLGPGVIRSVCVNVQHNWVDDVDLFLQSPDGQFIELSTHNGGNGNDYTETCFTETATTVISFPGPYAPNTAPPFTGDWLPEGNWGDLYDGDYSTNGEWVLLAIDQANGFNGILLDWTIQFEPSYQIYYEWTPAEGLSCTDCPMPEASPNESTTYTVRLYDSYGCEVFDSVHIDVVPAFPAPNVVCSNVELECLTFSWDDIGLPAYEVNVDGTGWMPANGADGLSHEICGLGAEQTVMIEVRGLGPDCNGFVGTGECTTPECEVPTVVSQDVTDVSCAQGTDGTLSIEMTGNFPPFTYEIDGQTIANTITAEFTGLSAALHDLVVTDASGCQLTLQVLIEEPEGMVIESNLIQDIQCNGADDGSAAFTVTDGIAPYNFLWSTGETDSVAVNLVPGNNSLTVTDAQGCEMVGTVFVDEPEGMTLELSTSLILCHGEESGVITSEVTGGDGAYTYQWNDPDLQTTPDAVDLAAGDYSLIVTDENNCSVTESITVEENSELTTTTGSTMATACTGSGDGTATVTPMGGGINGFSYQWDANTGNQTSATAIGLEAGWYYVTVTSFLNCVVTDSVLVTAPSEIEYELTEAAASCYNTADGSATVTVTGGTEPFTYEWSDGGDATPTRDDLLSGVQSVVITDANECSVLVEVNIPAPPEVTLEITQNTAVSCADTADGTLTVTATGGDENFTYSWDDPNAQNDATATDLAAGTYCVVVTDGNGCSATLCEEVNEPEALAVEATITDIACFGETNGEISVTVTGGSDDYEYLWNDAIGQTTPTAINLPAGDYVVQITDTNGCITAATYTVTEPNELSASADFTALSCDGTPDGTATVTGAGGTEPYTYTWQDGQTTETAVNLSAQNYQVTVTDANECEAVTEVTLTEPVQVEIDEVQFSAVTCFGGNDGEAAIIYSGGTAPYDIIWSNDETSENITNLTAGEYTVTITDQSGCTATESIVIDQPEDLVIELEQTSSLCHDGTDGTASVVGLAYGSTPADLADFTFAWNDTAGQNTAEAVNLTGGQTYEVLITDGAGCQWTQSITVDNPAPIDALVQSTQDVSCFGGNDGTAVVAGGGGTTPYSYQWPASAGNQTTATVSDLTVGVYTVIVRDANGCSTEVEAAVNEPEQLDLSFTATNVSCAGYADGTAEAEVTGGVAPFTLAWSSGAAGSEQRELTAGLYTVSVTDANNCSYNDTIRIYEPAGVLTEAATTDVSCFGEEDGYIDLTSTGGTMPYSYSLDGENYFGTSRLIGLAPDTYDVTVRDGNDCEFQLFDLVVGEPAELTVDLGEDIRISYGEQPELTPQINGSAGDNIYVWNPVGPFELDCYDCLTAVVDTFSGQAAFEVTVTDENGCTASDLITVFVDKEVTIAVPTGFSPNGSGDAMNEVLHVHGDSNIEVKIFRVYDRWGELLYENGGFMLNDMSVGWDGNFRGKPMPAGTYVWYIEVETEDGEPASFKGSTTLLR